MEEAMVAHALYQERDEFSGTEGVYLLPHHEEEVRRLRRQHEFIKASTRNALIRTRLKSGARVLDSGCTWLADLSGLDDGDESRSAELSLHGADIGGALFRSDPRLDLREHDIRRPFPAEWGWESSFDLVHQRLLVWGIGTDEWPAVVQNLVAAVKPGGSIQLVEAEWVLSTYSDDMVQQRRHGKVQEWSTASAGMDVHVRRRLPDLLRDSGMTNVQVEDFRLGYGATAARPEDRSWTAELLPQSFRHLVRNIPQGKCITDPRSGIPGVVQTSNEYTAFLDNLVVEMKAIGYTPILKWITAQRPSSG